MMSVIETKIVIVIIEKEDFMAGIAIVAVDMEYNSSGRGFVLALFQNMCRFHMMFERNFLKKPSIDNIYSLF